MRARSALTTWLRISMFAMALSCGVIVNTHAAADTILFVDDDAPPSGDGLTWDTAYRFLQDALANGGGTVQIRVAQGVYLPDQDEADPDGGGDRLARFHLATGVALMGGYAGLGADDPNARDIELFETILSGDLLGDDGEDFANNAENSYHVVVGIDTDETAVLDGFTITAGNADLDLQGELSQGGGLRLYSSGGATVANCRFAANFAFSGGAIFNRNGSFTAIANCTFEENFAASGGAIYNDYAADTHILDCVFSGNNASCGGAMYNNSSSPAISHCTFSGNTSNSWGGAIHNTTSSNPTIAQCTFTENSSDAGGAIHGSNVILIGTAFTMNSAVVSGGAVYSFNSSQISDCTFSGNTAGNRGGGFGFGFTGGEAVVTNCTFTGNAASNGGGGMHAGGDAVLTNCTFSANTASIGGGVYNHGALSMTDCALFGNSADTAGGGGMFIGNATLNATSCVFGANNAITFGGAIYADLSSLTLTNCTLSGNSAAAGGGMFNLLSNPTLINCTLTANTAGSGGGVWNIDSTSATVGNCILWANSPDSLVVAGPLTVIHSNVEGDYDGVGNIDADPLFVDSDGPDNIPGTEDDDLRLSAGSPCIDAAFNNAVPADVADLDGDGVFTEFLPFDLDDEPRFADDPKTDDTGCGAPVIVDMGAYEFHGTPLQPIRGDITGDLLVDGADLVALLGSWGECPTDDDEENACCAGDLDADGVVDGGDLVILLGNWG